MPWWTGWLLWELVLWMAGPGIAQAARVALVIANATYQHESTLRNPINDARLIETTLRQSLRFDQVIALHNGNRAQMLQELARFKRQAQGADLALVYYSGRGMINRKRVNHLLSVAMNDDVSGWAQDCPHQIALVHTRINAPGQRTVWPTTIA